MAGYDVEAWSDFAVMLGGAFAALAGLLFVAVSINVREIVGLAGLPARALEALVLLVTPLVVAVVLLVPGQNRRLVGAELMVVALVVGGVLALQDRRSRVDDGHSPRGSRLFRVVVDGVVFASVAAGGATLLAGAGGGLYWLVPTTLAALLGGLTNAWVLLIEILR